MYSRKKSNEDVPEQETVIWSCSQEGCKGWMRDNFSFENTPVCRICGSSMVKSTKMLPLLVNSNRDPKSHQKGVQIGD